MNNLKINQNVTLDLEAINSTEYAMQLFGNETRTKWIISDIIDFHKTVTIRPTNKSRVEVIIPMKFIKEVA